MKLLAWLGRESLFIFAIHGIIFYLALRLYGLAVHEEAEYLPDGILPFVIAIAVYAVSALLAFVYAKCKKKVKQWMPCHE